MAGPLLVNKFQRTQRVGGCEKMAMAFFKNIQFLRQPFIGGAQYPRLGRVGRVGGQGQLDRFLPGIKPLGVVKAGVAASMERLSLASRRASVRKAASYRGRFVGGAFSMRLGS